MDKAGKQAEIKTIFEGKISQCNKQGNEGEPGQPGNVKPGER